MLELEEWFGKFPEYVLASLLKKRGIVDAIFLCISIIYMYIFIHTGRHIACCDHVYV